MASLAGVFDDSGAVRRPSYWRLLAEIAALMFYWPAAPDSADAPPGRNRVVLVIPAWLAGDRFTTRLRDYLGRRGYRAFGWEAGFNWGPTARKRLHLHRRLSELCELQGGAVAVVGVSLGGIVARDLAYDRPADISHVVTIVSAFRLPTASTIAPLARLFARFIDPAIDLPRLATPLPVPATALYSRDDGIVAWESCRGDDPDCVNIECGGPHLAVCRNPQVLRAVAERLA